MSANIPKQVYKKKEGKTKSHPDEALLHIHQHASNSTVCQYRVLGRLWDNRNSGVVYNQLHNIYYSGNIHGIPCAQQYHSE